MHQNDMHGAQFTIVDDTYEATVGMGNERSSPLIMCTGHIEALRLPRGDSEGVQTAMVGMPFQRAFVSLLYV